MPVFRCSCLWLLGTVAHAGALFAEGEQIKLRTLDNEEGADNSDTRTSDSTYYMRFPLMTGVPRSTDEAIAEGYEPWTEISSESNCDNGGVGNIFVRAESNEDHRDHGLYPALFFRRYDDKLAGLIFAVREDFVARRPDFLAGRHPWSNAEAGLVGQIYWFQDPETVCLDEAPDDPGLGVYMNVAACIDEIGDGGCETGIKRIPDRIDSVESLSLRLNMKFTDQLCVEGMGDHYTYGFCSRSYAYAVVSDAEGRFNGIVNSIHLDETRLTDYAIEKNGEGAAWKDFVGPDADLPPFQRMMQGVEEQYPLVPWGLPHGIEAVPFYPLRGLVFDDELLPIGAACGEEGKVGYREGQTPAAPGCFICRAQPRVLLHVYKDRLPGRDSQTCSLPHKVTAEGTAKNMNRCGLCQVYIKSIASKSPSENQCLSARELFEASCGQSMHYGNGSTYSCNPLDFLGGKVLGFNGGGLTEEDGAPCVWDVSVTSPDAETKNVANSGIDGNAEDPLDGKEKSVAYPKVDLSLVALLLGVPFFSVLNMMV